MPETNRDSGGGVAVVLAIAWIVFLVWYPRSWQPSAVLLEPMKTTELACVVKLPAGGPMRLMVAQGSRLTLWFQPAAGDKPAQTLDVAPPDAPLPATHDQRTHIRVSAVSCLAPDRQSDCYAVLELPAADAPIVMSAGRIWVAVERQ